MAATPAPQPAQRTLTPLPPAEGEEAVQAVLTEEVVVQLTAWLSTTTATVVQTLNDLYPQGWAEETIRRLLDGREPAGLGWWAHLLPEAGAVLAAANPTGHPLGAPQAQQ